MITLSTGRLDEPSEAEAGQPVDRPEGSHNRPIRRPSAAVAIHEALWNEIVTLARPPGSLINERVIADRFGVSRTPVREALLRLASEGLIDLVPQIGTFVARIPLNQLPEAIVVRQALEETTARLAAERARPVHIAAMRQVIDSQQAAALRPEIEIFHQADEELHAKIAEASGHPGIWRLVRQAKVQLDRYRRTTLPQAGRLPRIIDQHVEIIDAIEAGESEHAARLMRSHVGALVVDLDAIRALEPDWFTDGS